MNREAIFHNPVSNYAFPISYEKFKVRLRAGKGDLDRVTLVIGNKYLWHTRKEVPMRWKVQTSCLITILMCIR